MKDLADNLRKEREKRGMSIQELSKLSGIAEHNLFGYEEGTREVPLEDFIHLVNALQIAPDILLDCQKEKTTKNIPEEIIKKIDKMTSEELDQLFSIIDNFFDENHN